MIGINHTLVIYSITFGFNHHSNFIIAKASDSGLAKEWSSDMQKLGDTSGSDSKSKVTGTAVGRVISDIEWAHPVC